MTSDDLEREVRSLDRDVREHLLGRVARAVLHGNRAADRGDRDAVCWHRGYRRGVYDALEALGYGDDAAWMKPRAFRWGRRAARGHPTPGEKEGDHH
jgi:hypothetical protein